MSSMFKRRNVNALYRPHPGEQGRRAYYRLARAWRIKSGCNEPLSCWATLSHDGIWARARAVGASDRKAPATDLAVDFKCPFWPILSTHDNVRPIAACASIKHRPAGDARTIRRALETGRALMFARYAPRAHWFTPPSAWKPFLILFAAFRKTCGQRA